MDHMCDGNDFRSNICFFRQTHKHHLWNYFWNCKDNITMYICDIKLYIYIYLKFFKNIFYILNHIVALLIPVDFNIDEGRWISWCPCNIFKDLFTFGSYSTLMRKILCSYSLELTEKMKHCYGIITLT